MSEFTKLLVLIPSRNRADLAQNAIRSVISQHDCEIEIMVSDNSTDQRQINDLKQFCSELNDSRLHYIQPEQPLGMSGHWEWAMQKALEMPDVSHVLLLTDRMIFKPHSLTEICEIISRFPDKVLSYHWEAIDDYETPIKLHQCIWSGDVFEFPTSHLIDLSSQVVFVPALPRMMNCCVPREVVEKVSTVYGRIFDSISPDFHFAYSCLAVLDSILYYDKPLLMYYGSARSNGQNVGRGILVKDVIDFLETIKDVKLAVDSPIPVIMPPTNAILNEYYAVKKRGLGKKFPEVNQDKYLLSLISDVLFFENPKLRRKLIKMFFSNLGFRATGYLIRAVSRPAFLTRAVWQTANKYHLHKVYALLRRMLIPILSERQGSTTEFLNLEQAVDYAVKHPQKCDLNRRITLERIGGESYLKNTVKILDLLVTNS